MSTSDRLYLEDACPTLQRLLQSLVDEPGAKLDDSDFLDFEVAFSTAMEGAGETLKLKVTYEFLANVLEHGSKELLEQVWAGLPLRFAPVSASELEVVLNTDALAENQDLARRCVQQVATTRIWLLVGPLVAPLRWLREAVATGDKAAAAAPQNAQQARKDAMGQPPAPVVLHVRQQETCCIVPKEDRILVILSIHLEDDVDVALGRAFCQEFAETNRKGNEFSLPCSFHEAKDKDMLSNLRGLNVSTNPNVGWLTLTLTDQHVRGATEERLWALARPVMTFRNFFLFHLKHTKSYLHSRLRKRLDHWQQQISKARRRRAQEKRRLISGKEFVPPSRSTGAV
mmetsp:Transcript_19200/g.39674  ORF Transcript_19200/g.39674 Transcript_19200/m.39674 type:complete len:342 (+) Transcript_19200:18-1043(+)